MKNKDAKEHEDTFTALLLPQELYYLPGILKKNKIKNKFAPKLPRRCLRST